MGRKNKRNARARRRHAQKARQAADPTGHIATMEKAMMESGEMGTHDISVLKELNKSSSTSRAVACSAIAHIVLNTPSFITALVRANGIKRLIELLHDMQDINVRTSAAGALRNISIQCSTKSSSSATDRSHVLKQMLDLDIASALVGLLSCESALFKNASGRHQLALLTQTFALLSLLCEYHHTSIVAVFSSQESAIQTAFRYLSVQPSTTTQTHSHAGDDGCTPSCAPTPASGLDFTLYHALSMEVLNFLSLTTEEDSVAIMALLNANGNEKISQLMMLTQPTMTINNSNNNSGASVTLTPRARVASCGILINVIPVLFAQVQSTSTSSSLSFSADDVVGLATSVLSTLSQALATHPTESGVALATSLREAEVSSTNANTKDLHTHITSWIDSVQAIRTALQLLTNISVNDEEADQDNSGSNHNKSSNDNLWQTLMVQQNILPQVLSHCQNYTTPSSSPSSSSSSSPATEWIAYVEKASGEISKLLSTKSKNSDNDSNSSNSNTNADGSQTITNANGEKVQIITVNGGSKGEDDNKIDFSLSSYLALLNSINVDATSCLNNMVLSFPLSLLGDTEGLFMRMSLLCDTIVNSANGSVGDEGNHQKLVCSLGLMHSILRKNPAIVLGDDQLQLLKSILTSSSSSTLSEAHLNIIGILGILGVNSQHFKDNALIGGALVHVLMQGMTEQKNSTAHTPVMYVASFHRGEIAAECLNAVFDVYSADNTHTQVIQQLQLLQVLHQAESFFSGQFENLCEFHDQLKGMDTMYKETSNKDDQKNGDSGNSTNSSEKASVLAMMMSEMNEMKREMILMRLDETLENLRNFLEYKPDHV